MKSFFKMVALAGLLVTFSNCDKDEGKLPEITFKSGGNYVSGDASVSKGSTIVLGITAKKTEDEDVLKKFDISLSKNGGGSSSVFNKDLSGSEGDNFDYDYSTKLDTVAGQTYKYTLSVTNRDGLSNKVEATVTTK
jgi:hypothetical protein